MHACRSTLEDPTFWTYQDIHLHVIRFSRALAELGVQRGQRVAVSGPGLCFELVLLLACENLGAVTASFLAQGDEGAAALFPLVDWVLSEAPQACPEGVRFQLLDAAFVERVAAIDPGDGLPHPGVVLGLHEPLRLSRTSGSSGRTRFMVLSREAQEFWIRVGPGTGGYTPDARLLVTCPLLINAAFSRVCACLRMGAAVLSLTGAQLDGVHITDVWALPVHLERLLAELPPGFARRDQVAVATVGGVVSPALRHRTAQAFGGVLVNGYGANEVGRICRDLDATGLGLLHPGVDIRIVDPQGQAVRAGETGIIALRTPAMVDGYIDDPQATQAAFRDGWFYSGDWGALAGPRMLRLSGRHDGLVNIGGIKMAAQEVEDDIRRLVPVRDCAVLSVNLQSGAATVGIALAVEAGTPQAPLLGKLQESLTLGASTQVRVLFMEALPHMASGKLDRMALHRLFSEQA